MEVHVFKAEEFKGEPIETEEMKPQWFFVDEIPFADMWPDDRYWFPLFLKGRKFKARFVFADHNTLLEREITEVSSIL